MGTRYLTLLDNIANGMISLKLTTVEHTRDTVEKTRIC